MICFVAQAEFLPSLPPQRMKNRSLKITTSHTFAYEIAFRLPSLRTSFIKEEKKVCGRRDMKILQLRHENVFTFHFQQTEIFHQLSENARCANEAPATREPPSTGTVMQLTLHVDGCRRAAFSRYHPRTDREGWVGAKRKFRNTPSRRVTFFLFFFTILPNTRASFGIMILLWCNYSRGLN